MFEINLQRKCLPQTFTLRIPSVDVGEGENEYFGIKSLKEVKDILKREVADEPCEIDHILQFWDPEDRQIHFDLTDKNGKIFELKDRVAFKIGAKYVSFNKEGELIWKTSRKRISDDTLTDKLEPLLNNLDGTTPMTVDLSGIED